MDFLPYYYREADTYKVNGKGILERYLEIFGNYFEDYIVKDTKDILDILDIDNCPEIYLNYLWEFLGQMPFAYGSNIDAEKWKAYFNGFASDEEMEELSQLWIIPKEEGSNFSLSTDQVRILLKYSVSLFKIRGTKRFFEILFKMYGLTCEIGMPPSERFDAESNNYWGTDDEFAGSDSGTLSSDYEGREMYISQYKTSKADLEDSQFDEYRLDKSSVCTKCITLPITITGHPYTSSDVIDAVVNSIVTTSEIESIEFKEIITDGDDRILWGLRWDDSEFAPDLSESTITINGVEYSTQDIVEYVRFGEVTDDSFIQFQKVCEAIFDRFLPFNVQADINYGFDIPCTYHISTYLKDGDEWLFLASDTEQDATNLAKLYLEDGVRKELQVKVLVSRSYRNQDNLAFKVGSITHGEDPEVISMGESEHVSGYILHITRALDEAEYLFKSANPNTDGTYTSVSLYVTRRTVEKDYYINYTLLSDSLEINPNADPPRLSVGIKLQGYVRENLGDPVYLRIRDMETGRIYQHNDEIYYTTPGVHDYCLVDFPIRKMTVTVTRVAETLKIYCNPISETLDEVGKVARSFVHIEGAYDISDPSRACLCIQLKTKVGSNPEQDVSIQDLIQTYIVDGVENNPGYYYAHGAVPLLQNGLSQTLMPVNKVRICCLKEARKTLQYLRVHLYKKNYDDDPLEDYLDIWDKLIFHKGRCTNIGTIVPDNDYIYSDWLDISEYQRSVNVPSGSPISRLEFHLVNSRFKYYEISNRSLEYHGGEYFETPFPGTYRFKPVLEGDTEYGSPSQAEFSVESTIYSDIKYGISVSPNILTYQTVPPDPSGSGYSQAVNAVVTIATNLSYSEGVNRDTDGITLPGFKFSVYEKDDYYDTTPGHIPTALKVINPNNAGWQVNSQSSKYEKKISIQFTDGNYGYCDLPQFPAQDDNHSGQYVLVLDDTVHVNTGASKLDIVTIHKYVDLNEDHVVIVPAHGSDPAWVGKDWTRDSSVATWNPSFTEYNNYEYFKVGIQGNDGSLSGYTTVVIYKLQDGSYVDTGITGTVGSTFLPAQASPLAPGKYRIKIKNSSNVLSSSYADLTVAEPVSFGIRCNPTSVPQNVFNVNMSVYVEAWNNGTEAVPSDQLMVKLVSPTGITGLDNDWHPNGHLYVIPCPNNNLDTVYTFTVKGDTTKTCTFTYTGQ